MLFIVRAFDDGDVYEYEFENLHHAEEQYSWEKSAEMWLYKDGKEIFLKKK